MMRRKFNDTLLPIYGWLGRPSPKRVKLRKAIKVSNQILNQLKLKKHPGKTQMGWIKKGFTFLGYWLSPDTITVDIKTQQKGRGQGHANFPHYKKLLDADLPLTVASSMEASKESCIHA